ncbi:hypothetical protein [Mycobacteroides abscessus]|uniref:hypothetical protein n=1 Tax=Mycobacteroides abscessus TaxID=36809 RepID=UPI00092B80BA|nr:hypothetical protein [Mycobacteroides abscessus]MDM2320781.1 hypothetical protein [Mycobacteroides abscessus]MDM2325854.1 hypothetical protein [Mycobacteroides abscessus]MDM2330401.1 hypothetical protein [Mycobacteroides abscessus]MDM2336281.1 hypothetical protein [Mycobacteroides abscessus]MDM2340814.1 hypothetical protein [Mycobacteroides abscessus]
MTSAEVRVPTGQHTIDAAAREHGWISNGGAGTAYTHRECVYRLPGTPAYASVAYSQTGVVLWAGGRDTSRAPRHFDGIGKVDRLVAFLAGN